MIWSLNHLTCPLLHHFWSSLFPSCSAEFFSYPATTQTSELTCTLLMPNPKSFFCILIYISKYIGILSVMGKKKIPSISGFQTTSVLFSSLILPLFSIPFKGYSFPSNGVKNNSQNLCSPSVYVLLKGDKQ